MKKFIAVLSALSLAAALTVGASATSPGDVNGDGKINSSDALGVLQYSVGMSVKKFDKSAADVNCDGKINSLDALKILRHAVGIEFIDRFVPSSQAEILDFYNTSLTKSYKQTVRIKTVTDDVCKYSVGGKQGEIKSNPVTDTTDFKDGKDKYGHLAELYGPAAKLSTDMLQSTSFIREENNWEITLTLKSEKVSVKNAPVYNRAGAFTIDFSADGSALRDYDSGTVTYSGTVITAIIDNSGRVTNLKITEPYSNELYLGKVKTIENGTYSFSADFSF